MGKSTEQVLTSTCRDGNCRHMDICEHGIDSLTECTACLAKSDLLLETENESKRFGSDWEILGEKYYAEI